jgi:hypothetical protein
MHMDELDDVLSRDQPVVPSSGFSTRVMDAVRDAAAAPPPFPFPWSRFIAGLAAAAASVVSGAVFLTGGKAAAIGEALSPVAAVAPEVVTALAVTAMCLTAVRVRVPLS